MIFLNEYVDDRLHRAVTTNISPSGVFLNRVYSTGHRRLQFGREDRFVQLEFELPGVSEVIWARGEVRYDELGIDADGPRPRGALTGPLVHGTGIYITDIARAHRRLMRDYVIERKRSRLQQILDLIRRNRHQ